MLISLATFVALAAPGGAPWTESNVSFRALLPDRAPVFQAPQDAPTSTEGENAAEHLGPFSWSYLDLSYVTLDADGYTDEPSGGSIGVSWAIWKWLYFVAGYGHTQSEILNVEVKSNSFNVGLGAHYPLMERLDVFATVSYVSSEDEAKAANVKVENDGHNLGGGLRFLVAHPIELQAEVNHVDVGDADSTSFGFSGVWRFSEHFGLRAGVGFGEDDSTLILAGIRYQR